MADGRDIVLELIEQRKGDALQKEAAELDKVADSAEVSGRSMRKMGDESSALSRRIEEQTTKVKALASEIERGGGDDKGLFRQFRNAERDLVNLKRVAKSLEEVGVEAGESMVTGIGKSLQGAGGAIKGPLIAAAVASAPFLAMELGGIVAGAVTGAVGVGGVVGGVVAAFQDQAVVSAADRFKGVLSREFANAGTQFVQPTIQAMGILEGAVHRLDLTKLFSGAVPYVTELADGVAGLVDGLGPGLTRAIGAAGPVVDELAKDLPEVGTALGDMLVQITESDGAVEGMAVAMDLLTTSIKFTGDAISGLSNGFHDMVDVSLPALEKIRAVTTWLPIGWIGINQSLDTSIAHMHTWQDAGNAADGTFHKLVGTVMDAIPASTGLGTAHRNLTRDTEAAEAAAKAHAKALDDEKRAVDDTFNAMMALDRANDAVAREWNDLTKAVRENGTSLDVTKDKGYANREMIRGQIVELKKQRDAAIASGDGSQAGMDKANKAFDKAVDHLINLATKAGFSRTELEKMAKKYEVTITTTYRDVHVNAGMTKALDLPKPPKKKALGGRAFAGESYTVGDGGRTEMFTPDTNGYIAPRVPASMSSGGSYGGSGRQLSPLRAEGGSLAAVLIQVLQDAAQRQYGGDPVLMLSTR